MTRDIAGDARPFVGADGVLRDRLAAERASVAADVAVLASDIRRMVEASTAANTDDEHDPEGATIAFERAQADALRQHAEARLAELDDAVARLDLDRYGYCERCGEEIAAERLDARPAARTCVGCARRRR